MILQLRMYFTVKILSRERLIEQFRKIRFFFSKDVENIYLEMDFKGWEKNGYNSTMWV